MKKTLVWALIFLLAFSVATATAETTTMVVTLPYGAEGVALMDENGRSLSTMISNAESNGTVYWTLRVENSGGPTAWLYTRDASGNWINTNVTYDMAQLFSSGGAEQGNAGATAEGSASSGAYTDRPWPVYDVLDTYSVSIIPVGGENRVQSRCGPSKNYHGAGAYKPYKVTASSALFIEGSYMLVDLQYTTVGHRRVYFQTSAFSGTRSVPIAELTSFGAYTAAAVTPVFGPGGDYDVFTEAAVSAGVPLQVYFEENGWVFAEFPCDLGTVRAWLPVEQISW